MIWKLLKFTAFVALLATAFVLSLMSKHVMAAEVTVMVAFQPTTFIAARCGPNEPWGCVEWQPAVDNPLSLYCWIRVPVTQSEVERGGTINRLRPRCDAPALSRGAGL